MTSRGTAGAELGCLASDSVLGTTLLLCRGKEVTLQMSAIPFTSGVRYQLNLQWNSQKHIRLSVSFHLQENYTSPVFTNNM